MKKVLLTIISIVFLLVPGMAYTQSGQFTSSAPPVSQPLVPEGNFAVKLVTALKLGTASSEAQAEDILTSVGIAPKNGWIANYPMTPIIVGELQNAVVASADENKLPMGRDEALKAFQDVAAEFSIAIVPGGSGNYAQNQPQVNPDVIDNYYYDEGPPVITYYPPPWDYFYLYAWVPFPFWWGGFYFPGYYCLHDFHRPVHVGGHHTWVTNHVKDPVSKQVSRVDPNGRRTAETSKATNTSGNKGFNTSEARNGATSILNRGVERSRSSNMTATLGKGSTNGSNSWSQSSGRSFNTPNRSFSGSSSGRGSFTCTNCHGGSSSFGHSSGSSSRSFSGGSFSGGHSFGGFSGGHSFGGFSGGGGGFHGGGGGHR